MKAPHTAVGQQATLPLPRAVFQSLVKLSTGLNTPAFSISPHSLATRMTSGEVKLMVIFLPSTSTLRSAIEMAEQLGLSI